MKKVFVMVVLVAVLLCVCLPVTVSAAGAPATVFDFGTEEKFDEHLENLANAPEECEIDWDKNMFHMTSIGKDPRVSINLVDDEVMCEDYPWMKIGVLNPSDTTVFEMHFKTYEMPNINGTTAIHFPISSKDTARKDYVVNVAERNLATAPELNPTEASEMVDSVWEGTLEYIRLDCLFFGKPSGEVPEGTEFYVDYVAFFATKADAEAFDITAYRTKPITTTAPVKTEAATATPEATTAVVTTAPVTNSATASATASTTSQVPGEENKDNSDMILWIAIGVVVVIGAGVGGYAFLKKKRG